MNLETYCKEVNRLAQIEADILNAGATLFGAVHHEFPASMLRYYFEHDYTPEQAKHEIDNGAGL